MEINRIQTSQNSVLTIDMDWREIYDQLLPRVVHFFFYKIGDVSIAEELAATTFEKVWKSREKYREQLGEYRFYIFGITQKVAADYFRKYRPEVRLETVNHLPDQQCVEEQAERHIDFQRLSKIVEYLPKRTFCRIYLSSLDYPNISLKVIHWKIMLGKPSPKIGG
jgi:DNA-directed RNA polymerase specialized sigma24 family protein